MSCMTHFMPSRQSSPLRWMELTLTTLIARVLERGGASLGFPQGVGTEESCTAKDTDKRF